MGSITGITDDEHTMRSIKAEANVFGDIVQGNFIDSYRQGSLWHSISRRLLYCLISLSLDNIAIFTIVTIVKARNLSYKAILGHTWISEFCPEADLVVKADDDFMVDLPLLRCFL